MKRFVAVITVSFIITAVLCLLFREHYLGPAASVSRPGVFIVGDETFDVFGELKKDGYLKSATVPQIVYLLFFGDKKVAAGGYRLDPVMDTWTILSHMSSPPDLLWVTIREGLRKEQIGEILTTTLQWDDAKADRWNTLYTLESKPEYAEGVYFPDTYLIPRDATPQEVSQQLINGFNEKAGPLIDQFAAKNIRWTTGVKIASLIQREAGGTADMKLISGIIWNRLDKGMKLEIDATLQYLHGKIGNQWWGKIDLSDKQSDSPYNLYRQKGLPPTPIANPGLAAIDAALNPEETPCLFYLHDRNKVIHCAETYGEHLKNIDMYLRN
jgi:UPF0755 protein